MLAMDPSAESPTKLASLVVAQVGRLLATQDPGAPYLLVGPDGAPVPGATSFLAELQARGRSETTLRSYGMDMLRWFRFCWAVGVGWDAATRTEARDFSIWLQVAGKPVRPHWRHRDELLDPAGSGQAGQR